MAEMALERFLEHPEGPEVLRLARRGLREGSWCDEYVAAIGQHALMRPPSWPEEQVAAFAQVHALIMGGSVAEVLVATRGTPRRDRDREGNAELLAGLPRPFTAQVDMTQHNADADGIVSWSEPIRVSLSTGLIERFPDGTTHPLPVRFLIPPGSAVLEIGSSLPSRTWTHLVDRGGSVARWPYGYSRFRLLVNLDPATMVSHLVGEWMRGVLGSTA